MNLGEGGGGLYRGGSWGTHAKLVIFRKGCSGVLQVKDFADHEQWELHLNPKP